MLASHFPFLSHIRDKRTLTPVIALEIHLQDLNVGRIIIVRAAAAVAFAADATATRIVGVGPNPI